jgi:hypothetical protein
MKAKLLTLGIALVLVMAAVGTSAFTSATVERQSNVDVVTDGSGLIGLEDGTSGPLISQNSTGALAIDLTNASASGANVHARYEFGDPNDPTNSSAFNITNNDGEEHTFDLEYTGANADGSSDADLTFKVYDDAGTTLNTFNATDSGTVSIDLAAGETAHVVMIIDTEADKGADYSGTLRITA